MSDEAEIFSTMKGRLEEIEKIEIEMKRLQDLIDVTDETPNVGAPQGSSK